MNIGNQLYDLQQIDLDLEAKAEELKQLESQLNESKELTQAREALEEERKRLAAAEKEQKESEHKVDDLQAKFKPLHEKMLSGKVTNPKELVGIEQQVESLKPQIRKEEDKILDLMSQIEALQKKINSKAESVGKIDCQWQEQKKELVAKQTQLNSAVEAAKQKKDEILASLNEDHLMIYNALQSKAKGQAVAKIEQGRCQGCRVSLPKSEMQQARHGEMVQCGNCHRILCAS